MSADGSADILAPDLVAAMTIEQDRKMTDLVPQKIRERDDTLAKIEKIAKKLDQMANDDAGWGNNVEVLQAAAEALRRYSESLPEERVVPRGRVQHVSTSVNR